MRIGRYLVALSCMICAVLVVAACGGGGPSGAAPTDEPPTETPFPTFAYVEPTKPPAFEQTGRETSTDSDESADDAVSLDPKRVERGLGRYVALECGNCHGETGEGSDDGRSLLDFSLSEDEFITFVRSGGDLGPSHQYSTDRLSNSGSRNLYEYLLSLAQSG